MWIRAIAALTLIAAGAHGAGTGAASADVGRTSPFVLSEGRASGARPESQDGPGFDGAPAPAPLDAARCGDTRCSPPEDCRSCPQDCGSCCGNHRCEPPEDCNSCPRDCGGCTH